MLPADTVEVDGQWGPYLGCNPNMTSPAPHAWRCTVHPGPPEWSTCKWRHPQSACPRVLVTVGKMPIDYACPTSEARGGRRPIWEVWRCNISKIFAAAIDDEGSENVKAWYSTPAAGQCLDGARPGDGSGCTWRLSNRSHAAQLRGRPDKVVRSAAVDDAIADFVEAYANSTGAPGGSRFGACGADRGSFCWSSAFYDTITGNNSALPPLPPAALSARWRQAFDAALDLRTGRKTDDTHVDPAGGRRALDESRDCLAALRTACAHSRGAPPRGPPGCDACRVGAGLAAGCSDAEIRGYCTGLGTAAAGPPTVAVLSPQFTMRYSYNADPCPNKQKTLSDSPPRAFRNASGVVHLFSSENDGSRASVGRALNGTLVRDCDVFYNSSVSGEQADPLLFEASEWVQGAGVAPDGTIHALVHNEWHPRNGSSPYASCTKPDCWVSYVTEVVSRTGGRSFTHAASPPHHLVASMPEAYQDGWAGTGDGLPPYGFQNPSNIMRSPLDGYWYALISTWGSPKGNHALPPWAKQPRSDQPAGNCLIRKRDLNGPPSDWRAWGGAAFNVSLNANPYTAAGALHPLPCRRCRGSSWARRGACG